MTRGGGKWIFQTAIFTNYNLSLEVLNINNLTKWCLISQSWRPCGLRCESAATRLLGLWVWIPLGTWLSFCCECCVLSGKDLCDGPITCPVKSYWVCVCVTKCDQAPQQQSSTPTMSRWKQVRLRKKDISWVHFYIFRKLTQTVSILHIPDTMWMVCLGPGKLRKVTFKTTNVFTRITVQYFGAHGGTLVEALRYKPEGRGFDSRGCH